MLKRMIVVDQRGTVVGLGGSYYQDLGETEDLRRAHLAKVDLGTEFNRVEIFTRKESQSIWDENSCEQ